MIVDLWLHLTTKHVFENFGCPHPFAGGSSGRYRHPGRYQLELAFFSS